MVAGRAPRSEYRLLDGDYEGIDVLVVCSNVSSKTYRLSMRFCYAIRERRHEVCVRRSACTILPKAISSARKERSQL